MALPIVTLPPDGDATVFAASARDAGAARLEIRTDLHQLHRLNLDALQSIIPLLVARRTPSPLPALPSGAWSDGPLEDGAFATVTSHHARHPLRPEQAVSLWKAAVSVGEHIKHVEPLGAHADAARLLETRHALAAAFPDKRVTVLCTGEDALPWRCVLARENALDYLALSSGWRAAVGQRLLADALRDGGRSGPRLGILGTHLDASRSPRIHPPPFDRLDLPSTIDLASLLEALHPHYRGFAVTSPFKRAAASACNASIPSVNTLWRSRTGWNTANTDVVGARHLLERMPLGDITVLGDGGVTDALRLAGSRHRFTVVTRAGATQVVQGHVVWTWPAHVQVPQGLRFSRARVAVVAYGPPAWKIARDVRARGGEPWMVGPQWLVAQAREQRRLWAEAT